MELELLSNKTFAVGECGDVRMRLRPGVSLPPGSKLWLFWDFRQEAGWLSAEGEADNHLTVTGPGGQRLATQVHDIRTLDLYPVMPEFLGLAESQVGSVGLRAGDEVHLTITRWHAPRRPIHDFHFWLVADAAGQWDFAPINYRRYRQFVERGSGRRIGHQELLDRLARVALRITGAYPPVAHASGRRTPGLYWGDLHGMALNQRPLDDFYNYAKSVSRLDFCAALLFSYNTCVGHVWDEMKEAVRRHTRAGEFVAFLAFECGTPPDDSHRCAYFPEPDPVPPVFCDSRERANEPILQARFHPDTVMCRTLEEYYAAVHRYGGFVTGHFHTAVYQREVLAELWQKQQVPDDEVERIFGYLRRGMRMGLVGGSDTHDSMPGNPDPEPRCPRRAGLVGVWAEELTSAALTEAILARRVFATTGSRTAVRFEGNGQPMGAELQSGAPRTFRIAVRGTARLASVELLRDGRVEATWRPEGADFEVEYEAEPREGPDPTFYLVRATQSDGHTAWSSPIWYG